MDILSVGPGAYIIYISGPEYNDMDSEDEERFTREKTEKLVCHALGYESFHPPVKIELYEGRGEMLLFATIDSTFRLYYRFRKFEDVIGACKCCNGSPASELYWYDGEYIMAVSICTVGITAEFSEFGDQLCCGALYNLFLYEHGKTIICDDAVNFIKNTF